MSVLQLLTNDTILIIPTILESIVQALDNARNSSSAARTAVLDAITSSVSIAVDLVSVVSDLACSQEVINMRRTLVQIQDGEAVALVARQLANNISDAVQPAAVEIGALSTDSTDGAVIGGAHALTCATVICSADISECATIHDPIYHSNLIY